MDQTTSQVVAQARALRALCDDLTYGPGRDAFLASLDREITALRGERVRISLLPLSAKLPPSVLRQLWSGLAEPGTNALDDGTALAIADDDDDAPMPTAALVRRAPLGAAARDAGIASINLVVALRRVIGSPLLFGHLLRSTDVVVLVGDPDAIDPTLAAALRRLAEFAGQAIHCGAGDNPQGAAVKALFKDCRSAPLPASAADFLAQTWDAIGTDGRRQMLTGGALARLALLADLAVQNVQAEAANLRFRQAELARQRRGDDDNAVTSDLRDQAETVKAVLDDWVRLRKDEIAQSNEDGVLPFDPRLLANKLTLEDIVHREEASVAEQKYGFLRSGAFRSLVTREFTLIPDPAAIEAIRTRMLSALDVQVRKDVELLNQQVGELADRMRRGSDLYPGLAPALRNVQLPSLARADFDRALGALTLEVEVQDRFVREGFFKRLAAGRMFASMAFSFVTMMAGLFVLFGEPSIKRGMMKFSGVIVIIMFIYFAFSLLMKADEEKHLLEDKLERIREQINQAVMRPLAKLEGNIVKAYQAYVDDIKAAFQLAIDSLNKRQTAERARIVEQRKDEDELIKGFAQRRQQASTAIGQKATQLLTALDKTRLEIDKLRAGPAAAAAGRPGLAPMTSARTAAAAPAAASNPATPAMPAPAALAPAGAAAPATTAATSAPAVAPAAGTSATERAATTAPQPATAGEPAATAKPALSVAERLAAMAKARTAGTAGPAAEGEPAAPRPSASERLAAMAKAREARASGNSEGSEGAGAPPLSPKERLAALAKAREAAKNAAANPPATANPATDTPNPAA